MEHDDPVLASIANRTLANLTRIELIDREEADRGVDMAQRSVYPVTQLINSLLGLIVFPKEEYSRAISDRPLTKLYQEGWPTLEISHPNPRCIATRPRSEDQMRCEQNHSGCTTLHQLIRVLRNGVSHFNIEFQNHEPLQLGGREIAAIEVSNRCPCCHRVTTTIRLTIDQVRELAVRYARLILAETSIQPHGAGRA
jgi:hypothetical protein